MPNKNNQNYTRFTSKTIVYLIIIVVLTIVICIQNYKLIPYGIIIDALILTYSIWSNIKRRAELSEQLKDLTLSVNNTAKTTLINSPFPLAIIETNGNLIWKSEKFVTEFNDIDLNEVINEIVYRIKNEIDEEKEKGNINVETIIQNKQYRILGSYVKSNKKNHSEKSDYTTILYFVDETDEIKKADKIKDQDLCLGIITIDNYDESFQVVSNDSRSIIIAQVEKNIYEWAQNYDTVILKAERDTYYCITNHLNLNKMINDKMSILDDIKKIKMPDIMQVTLSIAFSNDGETNIEKIESTRAVIDIALGRGGDQAIVKLNGKYSFFGGRSREVEKRTRVKSRMVAQALTKLIKESDNVFAMGHAHGDMDSIGSSLGIYRLAKSLGKDAKIINETSGIGIDKFLDSAKKTGDYSDCFINLQKANELMTENSLLVIVDTNKKTYVEFPELLEKTKKIVVIDHHRRSTDYLEDSILTFHEVYASSAAELVTEIVEYSQENIELSEIEMEALYAGIMLDTKNFTFKTGVRTFEAAAYLRKCGVDIIKVKKWFQSDLETYQTISDIISKSDIMNNNIAISVYEKEDDNANIIAAKAADELLTIGGITASFVLGKIENTVYISGRSIGDINVQIILEKLGGGGHITLAGAQLEDMSLEDAKQELINRINEYLFETEE